MIEGEGCRAEAEGEGGPPAAANELRLGPPCGAEGEGGPLWPGPPISYPHNLMHASLLPITSMKSEFVDVSETRKTLVIEIPSDQVDSEIERVTRHLGRTVRVPGFRPGKVPPGVVKQRFRGEIMHEVAHELVPRAVDEALRERGVEPIATPDVHDVDVQEGQPLKFSASFETVPPVDPGDYAEISLRRHSSSVEPETIDQALERLRQRAARFEPIDDRGLETGDTGAVDLERRSFEEDGTAGPSEKHENVSVEVGASVNPPGFDEQLTGMRAGDEKTFRVHYPADYSITELRSKEVEYTVKVRAVRRRVVPPLDDDLAKEVSDADTLEKLREEVSDGLAREAQREADRKLRSDLLKALAARVTFEVPEVLIDRDIDRRTQDFIRHLIEERIDPRQAGVDWEAFRKDQRQPAEEAVKAMIVLDEVGRREQLAVSDEDLEREVAGFAERSGRTVSAVRAQLEKDGELERLRTGLRRERAVEYLLSRVTIGGD
jgi:trigger factor